MSSKSMSLLQKIVIQLWGTLFIAILVLNVGFDFMFFTPILYLFIRPFSNGGPVFNFFTNWLMWWITPSILAPTFGFCGVRLIMDNLEEFRIAKKRNILILANHGSRVDWVGARFLGWALEPNVRVNFVVESFLKYMPAVGWHCYWICEDIFVNRSFKQDKVAISKRVAQMGRAGHPCMLFLAPEGMVVDTTSKRNAIGTQYLADCRKFCEAQGYPKFEYVLTPRYKGISVLKEHTQNGGVIFSAVMAFTRDGKLMNTRLDSPEREIPDLYDLFAGIFGSPIHIHVHTRPMKLSDNPTKLKKIMMDDYVRKDKLLKYFDENGRFPDEGRVFEKAKVPYFKLTAIYFLHTLSVILMMEALKLRFILIYGFTIMIFSVLIFNAFGSFIFGYTIESVPFETAIKPLMHAYIEMFSDKFKRAPRKTVAGNPNEKRQG